MTTRRSDVLIIGGAAAGLAGALQLARMRRDVIVVDAGAPRNRTAAAMHSFPGSDGMAPADYLAGARADAERFGATIINGFVTTVDAAPLGGFIVTLDDGSTIEARRVLVTAGITDVLPDIEGLRSQWGRGVIHCPYCHGYEVADKRIVVIDTNGVGAHQAVLFGQLSDAVTLVVAAGDGPTDDELARLRASGIDVVRHSVAAIVETAGAVSGVRLSDGTTLDADAVVVGPPWELNLEPLAHFDLATVPNPLGLGDTVVVGATGQTSAPGIYAAGNIVDPSQQVLNAAANGSFVAAQLNMDLRNEDVARLVRGEREVAEWEERYVGAGERWWSGNPNGTLAVEAAELLCGTVLDVGCGEGADAVWLAQRGWRVRAVDISATAIERARFEAAKAGVDVDFEAVDLLAEPPAPRAYDLVSIQYPALLKTLGAEPIRRIIDAVAPGGVLLIVGHDRRPMENNPEFQKRFGDYMSVEELAAFLGDEFDVEVHEIRPRPNPPEGAHHVDDEVLRARRRVAD